MSKDSLTAKTSPTQPVKLNLQGSAAAAVNRPSGRSSATQLPAKLQNSVDRLSQPKVSSTEQLAGSLGPAKLSRTRTSLPRKATAPRNEPLTPLAKLSAGASKPLTVRLRKPDVSQTRTSASRIPTSAQAVIENGALRLSMPEKPDGQPLDNEIPLPEKNSSSTKKPGFYPNLNINERIKSAPRLSDQEAVFYLVDGESTKQVPKHLRSSLRFPVPVHGSISGSSTPADSAPPVPVPPEPRNELTTAPPAPLTAATNDNLNWLIEAEVSAARPDINPNELASLTDFYQEAERNLAGMPLEDERDLLPNRRSASRYAPTPAPSVKRKADTPTDYGKCACILTYPPRPGVGAPPGKKCGDCAYGKKSKSQLFWDPCRALPGRGLGEELIAHHRGNVDFDNRTGPAAQFLLRYDALHDQQTMSFLDSPKVRKLLRQRSLITRDCLVKMSLKDYNQWQREVNRLQLKLFSSLRKRKELEYVLADLMSLLGGTGEDEDLFSEIEAGHKMDHEEFENYLRKKVAQKQDWLITLRRDDELYQHAIDKRKTDVAGLSLKEHIIVTMKKKEQRRIALVQEAKRVADAERLQRRQKNFQQVNEHRLRRLRDEDIKRKHQQAELLAKAEYRHQRMIQQQAASLPRNLNSPRYAVGQLPFRADKEPSDRVLAVISNVLLPMPPMRRREPRRHGRQALPSSADFGQYETERVFRTAAGLPLPPGRPVARLSMHRPGERDSRESVALRESKGVLDVPSVASVMDISENSAPPANEGKAVFVYCRTRTGSTELAKEIVEHLMQDDRVGSDAEPTNDIPEPALLLLPPVNIPSSNSPPEIASKIVDILMADLEHVDSSLPESSKPPLNHEEVPETLQQIHTRYTSIPLSVLSYQQLPPTPTQTSTQAPTETTLCMAEPTPPRPHLKPIASMPSRLHLPSPVRSVNKLNAVPVNTPRQDLLRVPSSHRLKPTVSKTHLHPNTKPVLSAQASNHRQVGRRANIPVVKSVSVMAPKKQPVVAALSQQEIYLLSDGPTLELAISTTFVSELPESRPMLPGLPESRLVLPEPSPQLATPSVSRQELPPTPAVSYLQVNPIISVPSSHSRPHLLATASHTHLSVHVKSVTHLKPSPPAPVPSVSRYFPGVPSVSFSNSQTTFPIASHPVESHWLITDSQLPVMGPSQTDLLRPVASPEYLPLKSPSKEPVTPEDSFEAKAERPSIAESPVEIWNRIQASRLLQPALPSVQASPPLWPTAKERMAELVSQARVTDGHHYPKSIYSDHVSVVTSAEQLPDSGRQLADGQALSAVRLKPTVSMTDMKPVVSKSHLPQVVSKIKVVLPMQVPAVSPVRSEVDVVVEPVQKVNLRTDLGDLEEDHDMDAYLGRHDNEQIRNESASMREEIMKSKMILAESSSVHLPRIHQVGSKHQAHDLPRTSSHQLQLYNAKSDDEAYKEAQDNETSANNGISSNEETAAVVPLTESFSATAIAVDSPAPHIVESLSQFDVPLSSATSNTSSDCTDEEDCVHSLAAAPFQAVVVRISLPSESSESVEPVFRQSLDCTTDLLSPLGGTGTSSSSMSTRTDSSASCTGSLAASDRSTYGTSDDSASDGEGDECLNGSTHSAMSSPGTSMKTLPSLNIPSTSSKRSSKTAPLPPVADRPSQEITDDDRSSVASPRAAESTTGSESVSIQDAYTSPMSMGLNMNPTFQMSQATLSVVPSATVDHILPANLPDDDWNNAASPGIAGSTTGSESVSMQDVNTSPMSMGLSANPAFRMPQPTLSVVPSATGNDNRPADSSDDDRSIAGMLGIAGSAESVSIQDAHTSPLSMGLSRNPTFRVPLSTLSVVPSVTEDFGQSADQLEKYD